jgi:hypothetical protein
VEPEERKTPTLRGVGSDVAGSVVRVRHLKQKFPGPPSWPQDAGEPICAKPLREQKSPFSPRFRRDRLRS